VVLTLSGQGGYITPWGGDEIRINDRYFKGGSTFRGFETGGIGPRFVQVDPNTGDIQVSGDALGGQFFAIGSAELSFPTGLPEQYGVKAALFSEFGTLGVLGDNVVSSQPNVRIEEALSIRASAGLSVFWRSPFGPIRFDFSEVLAQEEYDKTETFRFSTSTRF
jgi:outer membrane protein insertion porin family